MEIRKYYIDLIEGRPGGVLAYLLKLFLGLFSLIYWVLVFLRNLLYDKRFILRSRSCSIPVVGIGNLTWGGTGKTGLTLALCSMFSSKKIAVLTRGYGRDEVSLLKASLKDSGSEVFVGRDRLGIVKGVAGKYDLAILDDGFQYRRLKKDLEVVLLNGNSPFGNGRLIPAGPMREPKGSLKRADLAVITQSQPDRDLELYLVSINPRLKVFYASYQVKGISDSSGNIHPRDILLNKPVGCFSAIGYPQGFLETLNSIGVNPVLKFIYPDHHDLKEGEFRLIEKECAAKNISTLAITAKDRSRFRFETSLSVMAVEVEMVIERLDDFLSFFKRCTGL